MANQASYRAGMRNNAAVSQHEPGSVGELVCKVGPISIYRGARIQYPLSDDDAEYIEDRYTLRIDPAWLEEGNVVAVELEPPCYAVKTGNRLDEVDSLVEIASHPENENVVEVLVMEPESTPDKGTHTSVLQVQCEPR